MQYDHKQISKTSFVYEYELYLRKCHHRPETSPPHYQPKPIIIFNKSAIKTYLLLLLESVYQYFIIY